MGLEHVPNDPRERHKLLLELRRQAYQDLCDAVYQTKGYTPEAVPLPETLDRFGLLDDKAMNLLNQFGLGWKEKMVPKRPHRVILELNKELNIHAQLLDIIVASPRGFEPLSPA